METHEKPRVSLEQYHEMMKRTPTYAPGSVADLIERYVREMNGTDTAKAVKVLGTSHHFTLMRLQRQDIGRVLVDAFEDTHLIEHCKERSKEVCAATINQDVTYLCGMLKYAAASPTFGAYRAGAAKAAAIIVVVRPFLVKHGYVGKSTPRTRVPEGDEIPRLLAFFETPPKKRTKLYIDRMPDIIAFALVSARRIGEICRITHSDVDWEHKDESGNPAPIYWVRDMKHPTKKKGNDKAFTLWPELAEIIRRQPRKEGDDRIFPFNDKSVGAKYTRAKAKLGITGLRFHDSRRGAITTWLKKMDAHAVRKFVSGHDTSAIFDKVYDATKAEDGHAQLRKAPTERMAA